MITSTPRPAKVLAVLSAEQAHEVAIALHIYTNVTWPTNKWAGDLADAIDNKIIRIMEEPE